MTQITERAAFIQWAVEVERVGEMAAAHAWDNGHLGAKAWQAARRAPAAQVPQELCEAAKAVIDRWDSPKWKDLPATADYIARLRAALAAAPQLSEAQVHKPLTDERVREVILEAGYEDFGCPDPERTAFINGLRHGEAAHGITGEPT